MSVNKPAIGKSEIAMIIGTILILVAYALFVSNRGKGEYHHESKMIDDLVEKNLSFIVPDEKTEESFVSLYGIKIGYGCEDTKIGRLFFGSTPKVEHLCSGDVPFDIKTPGNNKDPGLVFTYSIGYISGRICSFDGKSLAQCILEELEGDRRIIIGLTPN